MAREQGEQSGNLTAPPEKDAKVQYVETDRGLMLRVTTFDPFRITIFYDVPPIRWHDAPGIILR